MGNKRGGERRGGTQGRAAPRCAALNMAASQGCPTQAAQGARHPHPNAALGCFVLGMLLVQHAWGPGMML